MMKTNLYAYDDILLEDIHSDREPDYIYANPSIYDIESNYKVVVNEEGSQLELLDNSNGYLRSIYVSTDMELIRHIENILEFYIKNKELLEELQYKNIIIDDLSNQIKLRDKKYHKMQKEINNNKAKFEKVKVIDEKIQALSDVIERYESGAKTDEYEAKAKAFDRIVEQRKKTGVITLGHHAWHIIRAYESGGSDAKK